MSDWKVCPTCSQECKYKDGILCKAYICAKKNEAAGGSNPNNTADFGKMFGDLFGKNNPWSYATPSR